MYAAEVTEQLFSHGTLEDRCSPRVEVHIPAQLRPSGARPFSVAIKDISAAGFACEALTTMRAGARCFVSIPGMESQQAEVVWNNGILVGCAFANLLHPIVLERLLSRYRREPQNPALRW